MSVTFFDPSTAKPEAKMIHGEMVDMFGETKMVYTCECGCGQLFTRELERSGRHPRYVNAIHRQRAYRIRREQERKQRKY